MDGWDGMGDTTEDSVVFPAFDILVTTYQKIDQDRKLASSVPAVSRHHAYSAYEIFDSYSTYLLYGVFPR